MIVVVLGVSASGKTTIGQALAARLGARFVDGDDLHPPANVEKMRAGTPLSDEDRGPWLEKIHEVLREAAASEQPLVVACSALKKRYRDVLRRDVDRKLRFVYLEVDRATLEERAAKRHHEFMPASLLGSQLQAFEPPTDEEALRVDAANPRDVVVEQIVQRLRSEP